MEDQKKIPITVLDAFGEALVVVDVNTGEYSPNAKFTERFGITQAQLKSAQTDAVITLKAALTKAFSTTETTVNWLPAPSVPEIAFKVHPVMPPSGEVSHYLAITVKAETDLSIKDSLTGLPLRAFLLDRIEHTAQTQKRHGGSVALIILGLDRFTLVNDAHGIETGDTLLALAADRIRACIRESDSAFRLDGDKFGILLTVTALNDVIFVAEKILTAMREPYSIDDQEILITTSIGIATYPNDTDDVLQLVAYSENSLHHAKQAGRNQYKFFSKDLNGKALSRFTMASRIRKAISNDEFTVYYQPKVRSDDNSILGAEALARWQDPECGLILPGDFIPIAEEIGLIEEIGKRILEICCTQGRKWLDAGFDPITLSCNLSQRQFRNSCLVDNIAETLHSTGLPGSWLDLEITEAMILADLDSAVKKMAELRAMGVGLSISDFSTGHQSLTYQGRFPVTSLKLDREFVTDVDSNPKAAEIARSIIGLSKGLNVDVIAEGCEIPAHLKFLRENGCDAVQGFYFSKPVPATEFEAMLRAGMVYPVPSITA